MKKMAVLVGMVVFAATAWMAPSAGAADLRGRTTAGLPVSEPVAAPRRPQVTSGRTHSEGVLVYATWRYAEGTNPVVGFGFRGKFGSGWAEEQHLLTSPSYGRIAPSEISYPFNHACETLQQYESAIEVWVYDSAGIKSRPRTIMLRCDP